MKTLEIVLQVRFDLAAELTGLGSRTQLLAVPSVSSIPVGVLELTVTRRLQKFLGLQVSRLKSSRKYKLLKTKKQKTKKKHPQPER